MPIMSDAKWIERVPPGHANFLDDSLSLGLQRNKILLPYPRPKQSMTPPVVVVHNYFGCDKHSRIMVTLWDIFHYYVIMRVPSRLLTTLVSILPLLCDNESVIKITYNPCEHSRTKHIDIRYHFLRDHAIKGDIVISHVETNDQLPDIFTKPLDVKQLCELWSELNITDSRNVA
jgi:hypothetical protein